MHSSSMDARRNGVHSVLALALISVSAIALSPEARAQTASNADVGARDYDIPSQPLASALLQFARAADLQFLFDQGALANLQSRPLHGRFPPDVALAQLLPDGAPHIAITDGRIVIADNAGPQDQTDAPMSGEIVVTGSRIRGATPAGANLIVLDRTAIDATGRNSVQDVIQTLPQNFAGSQNEGTQEGARNAQSNVTFASTVNLRGLGADATLTLLDGHRLAAVGTGNFVDISGIPLSAVSRVEVLADGASATYGSDAVGGVVNIILNQNFQGAETGVHYGGATQGGAEDFGFSQLAGFAWRGGQLTAGYEYRRRGDVDIADRSFSRSADFRDRGGNDFRSINSNPGNIVAIGDNDVAFAIPHGQDGTSLSEQQLLAGATNLGEFNQQSWLLPRQTSNAIFLSGHQDLTAHLQVFADALASDRRAYSEHANLAAELIVPETNAYRRLNNLFPGQGDLTIEYDMTNDLGPVTTDTESQTFSGVIGSAYTFDNDWRVEASVAYASSSEHVDLANFFDTADAALASSDLSTAFNPFADGSNTNPAILDTLTFGQHEHSRGTNVTYGVKADGPLMSLWAGPLRAAFGVEQRTETFRIDRVEVHGAQSFDIESQQPGERTVDAVFAEMNLPLIAPENDIAFARSLTLSLSARHEDASDYGASTTPKFGARWEVVDGFAFHGSWGRSFKGPNFEQLRSGATISLLRLPARLDPFANDATTGTLFITGSNPELKPERAETWTAGFDFQPAWLSGFRASATYFDIDFADRISLPGNPFAIIANPAGYESVVVRNPSPELVASYLSKGEVLGSLPPQDVELIVDLRDVNLASQRVRGVDLSAEYTFATRLGDISLSAASGLLFQHDTTLARGATPTDELDTVNNPLGLRTRFGANWRAGAWSVGANLSYAGSYEDNISVPHRRIKSASNVDMQVGYRLTRDADAASGSDITLSIQNLFDRDPLFVNNPTGYAYDASNASPLGRVVSLELRHRW